VKNFRKTVVTLMTLAMLAVSTPAYSQPGWVQGTDGKWRKLSVSTPGSSSAAVSTPAYAQKADACAVAIVLFRLLESADLRRSPTFTHGPAADRVTTITKWWIASPAIREPAPVRDLGG
jgi:hypothetical protein